MPANEELGVVGRVVGLAGQDKVALLLLAGLAVAAVGAVLGSVLIAGAGGVLVVFAAGMVVRYGVLMRGERCSREKAGGPEGMTG